MTRFCCCRCCRCYCCSAVAHDTNPCLLNLSALPFSKVHLRKQNQRCSLGRRRAQLELLATARETQGCARLRRAGRSPVLGVSITDLREAALGSCIKQGIKRSCQWARSIIWAQPGYPGRKRAPSKEGEEDRGRERERGKQATPESLSIILRGTQVLVIHYQKLSLNTKLTLNNVMK